MRRFLVRPLAASLALHAVAVFAALSLRWEEAGVQQAQRGISLIAPAAPPKRNLKSAKALPSEPAATLVRRFEPRVVAHRAAEARLDSVEASPPPVAVALPVLPAVPSQGEFPAPPPPAIKLGGFGDAAATPERVRMNLASAGAAFGSVGLREPEGRSGREIRAAAFGDVGFEAPAKSSEHRAPPPLTPVEILYKPQPDYTEEARRLRLEGEVVLEVRLAASGAVEVLRLIRGLGHGLDEAAQAAARAIRFRPAMQAGRPVDTTAIVHIEFQLAY